MPFNSYTFIIFFCIVLILHYSVPSWKLQKINLLIASHLFYSAWNPIFVLLLIFSTLLDWTISWSIYKSRSLYQKKSFLFFSLFANLGLLAFFKYGQFIIDNVLAFLNICSIRITPPSFSIVLPVGISFYTFQTLSYTIDVYRGNMKPTKSIVDYSLYVSFFPQLVAGPIVRASDFIPQCESPKKATADQFGLGLLLLSIGLFMKIIIADTMLAPIVDRVYSNPELFRSIDVWSAVLAFSCQIFCDFSGYSTCAIGCALCLGFLLPDNFNAPYAAVGFSDFWSRWHMSLSTWLRDYLYISLGGNRVSEFRTHINIMITMLIGGLWHGASWLFVIWGGLHGSYLLIERHITEYFKKIEINTAFSIILSLVTFLVISITWVFFRSDSLANALCIFRKLSMVTEMNYSELLSDQEAFTGFVVPSLLFVWHIIRKKMGFNYIINSFSPMKCGICMLLIHIIIYLVASGDDRAFIYFQF